MHKVDSAGSTAGNEFTDGDPQLGIARTRLEAKWMNSLQRELTAPIQQVGIALSDSDDKQLMSSVNLHVTTIAALRALSAPTVQSGSVLVHVEGYAARADGGGGYFRWQGDSVLADDDDMIVRPSSNPATGRWLRVTRFGYRRTSVENAVSVTPVDHSYEPRNVLRQGLIGDDATDDAPKAQAAQNAGAGYYPKLRYRFVAGAVSPFNYGNTASPVYRSVKLDASDYLIEGWDATVHMTSRAGAAAGDIQPAFATDKNPNVGDVQNLTIVGLTWDLENDGDGNSNQRCLYLTGVDLLRAFGTHCMSSGAKRGYFMHVHNSRNVLSIGHVTQNISGGQNYHYTDNVAIVGSIGDGFNEGLDFQWYVNRVSLAGHAYNGGHRTGQMWDFNGCQDVAATAITANNIGNLITINYFGTAPETYADFVNGIPPTALLPTARVAIYGVSASEVGDIASNRFAVVVGNDWDGLPHGGYGPVEDIILSGIQLKDTTMVFVWEATRLTIRDMNLSDVQSPTNFYALDLRSQFSDDSELEWSDLDVHIDNATVNGCNRGAIRVSGARRATLLGVKTKNADSAATGNADLRIEQLHTRGSRVIVDNCDIEGDVSVSGSAAAIPAWAGSAAVVKNKLNINGGKYYRCIQAGVTAAAGGPTGTGSNIADGTAAWEYMSEPFQIFWGSNNHVGGQIQFVNDAHKYVHGRTVMVNIGDLAATGLVARVLYIASRKCYIPRASMCAAANVAADAINRRSFSFKSMRSGASTTIQAIGTDAGMTAFVPMDVGFSASEAGAYLEPGDTFYVETQHDGTGKAITGLSISFEILEC